MTRSNSCCLSVSAAQNALHMMDNSSGKVRFSNASNQMNKKTKIRRDVDLSFSFSRPQSALNQSLLSRNGSNHHLHQHHLDVIRFESRHLFLFFLTILNSNSSILLKRRGDMVVTFMISFESMERFPKGYQSRAFIARLIEIFSL